MDLVKGNTYYLVTYADPDLTMPGLKPVVFIGENAYLRIEEEDIDTLQFQDTVSFQQYGYVMDAENKNDCWVELLREEEIGSSLVDLEGALAVVEACLKRSELLGRPALKVAKGKWVSANTETWVQI